MVEGVGYAYEQWQKAVRDTKVNPELSWVGIGGASDAEKLCSRWRVRILYRTRALAENALSKRMPVRGDRGEWGGERPLRTRQVESKVEPKLRWTAAAPLRGVPPKRWGTSRPTYP